MMSFLATFASLSIDGIAYGMMLFLISVGLTVTLGVMRVVNLAHSAFAMIGGYLTLWVMQRLNLNFYVALVLGVAGTMLVGAVLERTLYRWVYEANGLGQLLMTIGLAFIISALFRNLAGAQLQAIPVPDSLQGNWTAGPLSVSIYRIFALACSIVVAIGIWLGLERTNFGAKLRAAVDNPRMARCVGIDVPMVFSITFAIGCGLSGLGGALSSQILPLEPYYALKYLVLVLIVVAAGGLGSLRGSLYAALLLALIDTFGRYYLPVAGAFVIYLAVLAILLIRPHGLVGRA
ncbi:branched-chain amino acid ABC transporter permease [Burkholderia cenocepacia]|nr:branched-chain amino acid ABC transporter permease [Burkholderia cenocepacia]